MNKRYIIKLGYSDEINDNIVYGKLIFANFYLYLIEYKDGNTLNELLNINNFYLFNDKYLLEKDLEKVKFNLINEYLQILREK